MNQQQDEELLTPAWEQQPDETKTAFDRFFFYYLTQNTPRTVVAAYRSFIEATKGKKKASEVKKASGQWLNWATGRDRNGDLIPGALTWRQRGEAWDAYKRELVRAGELEEAVAIQKKARGILDDALTKIEGMVKNMQTTGVAPHQVAAIIRAVYGEVATFYDLEPPIRLAQGAGEPTERPFDLQAWEAKRIAQMKQIATMRAAAAEEDDDGGE